MVVAKLLDHPAQRFMHDGYKPLQRFGMRAAERARNTVKAVVGRDAALGVVHAVRGGVFQIAFEKVPQPRLGKARPRTVGLEQLRLSCREPSAHDRGFGDSRPVAYLLQIFDRRIDRHAVIGRHAADVQAAVAARERLVRKNGPYFRARPLLKLFHGLHAARFQRDGIDHSEPKRLPKCERGYGLTVAALPIRWPAAPLQTNE
jgi:hypothetical protein